jgi:tRNA(Ile)-lysidine synthetase-like protein
MELGSGFQAEVAFDVIRISRAPTSDAVAAIRLETDTDGAARWGRWSFAWQTDRAGRVSREGIETWVTCGSLGVRGVESGDRLVPLGGVGRRKVRRLLMEARIPVGDRGDHPVLVRDRDVLWVPAVCRSREHVPHPGEEALWISAEHLGDGEE